MPFRTFAIAGNSIALAFAADRTTTTTTTTPVRFVRMRKNAAFGTTGKAPGSLLAVPSPSQPTKGAETSPSPSECMPDAEARRASECMPDAEARRASECMPGAEARRASKCMPGAEARRASECMPGAEARRASECMPGAEARRASHRKKRFYYELLMDEEEGELVGRLRRRRKAPAAQPDFVLTESFRSLRRKELPVTYRLHDDLLRYYRKGTRPVTHPGKIISVSMSVFLYQIIKLDAVKNTISLSGSFELVGFQFKTRF
uniref:Neurotransmitter-gated ion-channel ligand-binding domain-containing protein n=1 Tax=Globodera rostochiensis TaxID=31243 RepID=A0A914HES5_GLORO